MISSQAPLVGRQGSVVVIRFGQGPSGSRHERRGYPFMKVVPVGVRENVETGSAQLFTHVTQKSVFKRFLPLRAGVRPEWIPSGKSPADVRQESDGVCSDPARDVSLAGSSAIALGNHRVCCPARRHSCLAVGRRGFRKDLFASFPPSRIPQVGRDPRSGTLSERKKTQVVFGAQTSITLCATSVIHFAHVSSARR